MEIVDTAIGTCRWTHGRCRGCRSGRCGRDKVEPALFIEIIIAHFQQVIHVAYQITEFDKIVNGTSDKCRPDDGRIDNAKPLLKLERQTGNNNSTEKQ